MIVGVMICPSKVVTKIQRIGATNAECDGGFRKCPAAPGVSVRTRRPFEIRDRNGIPPRISFVIAAG